MSEANGDPGVVALTSSPERADAVAAVFAALAPTSLVVHHPAEDGPNVVRAIGPVAALVDAARKDADEGLYEIAARSLQRHRRTWELGESSPGVSTIYLTRVGAGLSADDYHRYWEREHGPRALRHHMGMWDYEQLSVTRTHRGEAFDGIAVVQWPRPEELADRFTDGPLGTDIIRHDAATFTDLGRLERYLTSERIIIDHPLPASGLLVSTDARHLDVDVPADRLWARLADFGAILDWWPSGFSGCSMTSDVGVGATRVLLRDGGSRVVERLMEFRPEERMLQLIIDEGLPGEIHEYTCRYEVREVDARRSRLDWYPKAVIGVGALDLLATMVDRGWSNVVTGLSRW